jgi:TonB dependent receptor
MRWQQFHLSHPPQDYYVDARYLQMCRIQTCYRLNISLVKGYWLVVLSKLCLTALLLSGAESFTQDAPAQLIPAQLQAGETDPQRSSPPQTKTTNGMVGYPVKTETNVPDPNISSPIVVAGASLRGSVIGNTPAERTLNPDDIASYGAEDIGELIKALGPQVTSNRGLNAAQPVVLINGRRVSGYAEVANIPTAAIERTEIFTEELALKYGYSANQKVVNIITYEYYNLKSTQFLYALPIEGGRNNLSFHPSYLLIKNNTRFLADINYSRSSALLESERSMIQSPENTGEGAFRTLLPKNRQLKVNATIGGTILDGVAYSLNGRFGTEENESLLGPGIAGHVRQNTKARTTHFGIALNGQQGKWRWVFTGGYDRTRDNTLIDANGSIIAPDFTQSINAIKSADLGLSGALLNLPAGPIFASIHQSLERRELNSLSSSTNARPLTLLQNQAAISASFDMPLARSGTVTPSWIGDLSINTNLKAEKFTNYGTLVSYGYGLNWRPITAIRVSASFTNQENAPDLGMRGSPIIIAPNVRIFDYRTGQSEDVVQVYGGNLSLQGERRRSFTLAGYIKPLSNSDLSLSMDYSRSRTDNPVGTFSVATPLIEAAFPERFTRDNSGRLSRIDNRPINFALSQQSQIHWGIN